uniref:(northern house mosquito) hypothetical protein n=1 Tax=Culex pipiens TaxID=7175 RepID=A0A8D8DPS6_CULPI
MSFRVTWSALRSNVARRSWIWLALAELPATAALVDGVAGLTAAFEQDGCSVIIFSASSSISLNSSFPSGGNSSFSTCLTASLPFAAGSLSENPRKPSGLLSPGCATALALWMMVPLPVGRSKSGASKSIISDGAIWGINNGGGTVNARGISIGGCFMPCLPCGDCCQLFWF